MILIHFESIIWPFFFFFWDSVHALAAAVLCGRFSISI